MKHNITKETRKIIQAAREASMNAAREARALGLSIRIVEKGIIYDVDADGQKVLVSALPVQKDVNRKLKRGTILHLQ